MQVSTALDPEIEVDIIANQSRLRRIKCDEAKPSCQKCSSTGRRCEGYFYSAFTPPSSTPSSSQHSSSPETITALSPCEISQLSRSRTHSPLTFMQPINKLSTDRERRCFKFFQDHTVTQLDGFFNSPFWQQMSRLLLQTAYHEPAVRHAAVALGALHEGFELGYQPNLGVAKEEDFAVQQYVKALGYLVEPIQKRGKQAADVALVTCILFVCFEVSTTLEVHHAKIWAITDRSRHFEAITARLSRTWKLA